MRLSAILTLSRRTIITTPAGSNTALSLKNRAMSTDANNPLTVNSTFRDGNGHQVRPHGLEWHCAGTSYVSYAPRSKADIQGVQGKSVDDQAVRRWIVEAHNKFSFARDLPFRKADDIAQVSRSNDATHWQVEWKPLEHDKNASRFTIPQIDGLLKMDKSAKGEEPPAEVWINGEFAQLLQPDTLDGVLEAVAKVPSRKLTFSKSRGMIRIERRFVGRIVGQDIFEHLLDNLYAMEDPKALDELTLIGTATLPDWIMGGELTSRLWLKELENGNVLCLRPLYHDDIDTSDRKYELERGKDDARIAMVREELERLRYLASLPSPFDESKAPSEEKKEELGPRELAHRRNRRRMFGL